VEDEEAAEEMADVSCTNFDRSIVLDTEVGGRPTAEFGFVDRFCVAKSIQSLNSCLPNLSYTLAATSFENESLMIDLSLDTSVGTIAAIAHSKGSGS